MGWQVFNVVVLHAGNTIINPSGIFIYDGAPAAGDLMIALAPAAGSDQFGNTFVKGVQVGELSDNSQVKLLPGAGGSSLVQFTIPSLSLSNIPNIAGGPVAGTFSELLMSGPAMSGGAQDDWVQVILFSNDTAGTFARGELRYIDTSGAAHVLLDWGKSDQAVHIPAGGGPFISAETFHTVSNAAGYSGTMRVKKLPWNAIWLDVELTVTSGGGVSDSFGSLPDSTYYPTSTRHFPLSLTGNSFAAAGSFLGTPRVNMPTSGAVKVEIPTLTASAALTLGCSVMYPTN